MSKKTRSNKFRYSSLSILLSAVVILAVIVLNVVATALADRYDLYADMTTNSLYSVSDKTITLLEDLDTDYIIRFCQPLDQVAGNSNSMLIYNCAKEFAAKMDNVSIDYLDVLTYPGQAAAYQRSASDSIYTTDVIIQVKDQQKYRRYNQADFYVVNSDTKETTAFRGEQRFAAAMMQLAGQNRPIAAFTSGHGEVIPSSLQTLFEDTGYDVQSIDLTKDEIPAETKVMIISQPTFDFYGLNQDGIINEIDVIDKYLENFGNLMVFMGANTPQTPELDEYLAEWGIAYGDSVVKDSEKCTDTGAQTIIATLAEEEGLGASITKDMKALDSQPITLVKNARPLYHLFESKNSRAVSSVLTTSKSAQAVSSDGENTRGQFDLMTISRETTSENAGDKYSYVLACASTEFCDEDYLSKNAYGNRDILYSLMKIFNKDQAVVSIDYKEYDSSTLTISAAQARGWLIVTAIVIPIIVFALGVIVWVRRKRL